MVLGMLLRFAHGQIEQIGGANIARFGRRQPLASWQFQRRGAPAQRRSRRNGRTDAAEAAVLALVFSLECGKWNIRFGFIVQRKAAAGGSGVDGVV